MSIFGSIKDKITRYAEVHINLFKLNMIKRTSNLMSFFMFAMICLFVLFCILLLAGMGLVEAFSAAGMSRVAATFLTAGVYFVVLFILMGLRRNITRFFADTFIGLLTEDGDDEDDNKKE